MTPKQYINAIVILRFKRQRILIAKYFDVIQPRETINHLFCARDNNRSAGSHQLRGHEAPVFTDDWRRPGTSFGGQGLHATVARS